jgi:hypothetical protein
MPCNPIRAAIWSIGFSVLGMKVAFAADESTPGTVPGAKKCEIAVVNPVSGYAECVKPRGVPVDPPPPRPQPSPEECLKHPDLDLDACRQKQPPKAQGERRSGQ